MKNVKFLLNDRIFENKMRYILKPQSSNSNLNWCESVFVVCQRFVSLVRFLAIEKNGKSWKFFAAKRVFSSAQVDLSIRFVELKAIEKLTSDMFFCMKCTKLFSSIR